MRGGTWGGFAGARHELEAVGEEPDAVVGDPRLHHLRRGGGDGQVDAQRGAVRLRTAGGEGRRGADQGVRE